MHQKIFIRQNIKVTSKRQGYAKDIPSKEQIREDSMIN